MRNALAVALGGAAGSLARYLVALALAGASTAFPWSTLAINVAGSFLLGVVLALFPQPHAHATRLLLGAGFCGGFTTYSTFSAETVALAQRGDVARAAGYVAASLALGLGAAVAGGVVGARLAGGAHP